jgi:hypothetical protein
MFRQKAFGGGRQKISFNQELKAIPADKDGL